MKWWLAAWLGCIGAAVVSSAAHAAEPRPIAVRTSEAVHAGCPTEPSLFDRVEAQLPHIYRAAPGEPAIRLELRVEQRGGTTHGTLTFVVGDVEETRDASSASCDEVLSALGMMAAIVIGEESARIDASPPRDEVAEPPARQDVPVETPPRTARAEPALPGMTTGRPRPQRRTARLTWAVGAGAESDATIGRALLAKWFAQATFPHALEPTLRLGFSRSIRSNLHSKFGAVSAQWAQLTFASCATAWRGAGVGVAPCLELEAGTLATSVAAAPSARTFSFLWWSAGASVTVARRVLGPLSLEAAFGARAPLIRDELYFEPNIVVHRVPAIVPYGAVALVVDFR